MGADVSSLAWNGAAAAPTIVLVMLLDQFGSKGGLGLLSAVIGDVQDSLGLFMGADYARLSPERSATASPGRGARDDR